MYKKQWCILMNQSQNPLITKSKSILPGQVFRLPSRGVFYKGKGILSEDVIDGEVLVYQMRLREELGMKAVDAIFQGTAVTDAISYCVPQILKPAELVSEDVDYLLTAIKKITHGNTILYRDKCFKLSDAELSEDEKAAILQENAKREMSEQDRVGDVSVNETVEPEKNIEISSGFCEFNIPVSHFLDSCIEINEDSYEDDYIINYDDFTLYIKPLSFTDFKDLSTIRLKENKGMSEFEYVDYLTEFSNMNITTRLLRVDDVEDKKVIYEWVDSLSLESRTTILNKIAETSKWGIDFDYEITCPKCGITKKTNQSYINPLYFFL